MSNVWHVYKVELLLTIPAQMFTKCFLQWVWSQTQCSNCYFQLEQTHSFGLCFTWQIMNEHVLMLDGLLGKT